MKEGIKRISIEEFREAGYLQELNRNFLHPLGLALEVEITPDGERLGGVWDYREDEDGMWYLDSVIDPAKAARVQAERLAKSAVRIEKVGAVIQPVPGDIAP